MVRSDVEPQNAAHVSTMIQSTTVTIVHYFVLANAGSTSAPKSMQEKMINAGITIFFKKNALRYLYLVI